ncbi:adenosylcobinamide amidohydrolase [Streptomyces sp. NPDC097619]|uniref:adenosylcobinamide amidohydrolase n=1 Tax=Streptomyces sp. NPDC097619 TaxID=3157228 RepID=UPI0033277D04
MAMETVAETETPAADLRGNGTGSGTGTGTGSGEAAAGAGGSLSALRELARPEDGEILHALLWVPGPGRRMVSSAVLGGGIGEREWVLNAQVAHGYRRTDPDRHLAELARAAGARGAGVGLMTAADVTARGYAADGGAEAVVTSGVSVRGWAAAPPEDGSQPQDGAEPHDDASAPPAPAPGTINIVVSLPVALSDAALVNAVLTATEAKVQALLDAGYDCSGTPTDAVCVAARSPRPGAEVHAFAGPRSPWGSRLARAVYRAVRTATPPAPHGPDTPG